MTTMAEPLPPVDPPSPRREEGASAAYLSALKRYPPERLHAILDAIGPDDRPARTGSLAARIADRLAVPDPLARALEPLGHASRLALRLFALTESAVIPAGGLALALRMLGEDPSAAVVALVERGLLAVLADDPTLATAPVEAVLAGALPAEFTLISHPSAAAAIPPLLPVAEPPQGTTLGRSVREADGLEPMLRVAALWQRVAEAPLRRTQQGSLFKRDRERVTDDPALVGPIADALAPLPDMAWFWLALAESVGLLVADSAGQRTSASPAEYWTENAVHLPQMLGNRWLGLRGWHETLGWLEPGESDPRAALFVRLVVLLWLARLDETAWVALDDLAAHLDALAPGWAATRQERAALLESVLLGPGYQLGLVRVAEGAGSARLVQLTALGRYVLGLGHPPPPRETFEQFLFVQPNFEVIAYRQGLNPWLVGLFSRFLQWSQLGAALELRLTPESFYHGLESGLSMEAILGRLERHSGRTLPVGVVEALKTWSGRRARLTFFASATLVEFASPEDLEAALPDWPDPEEQRATWRVTDRILLVTDESSIPLGRIRMSGSRDYRRAPEPCVEVGPDGLTLAIDLARSDLFVEAELARLADEIQDANGLARDAEHPRRRYRISLGSLRRALAEGMTAPQIARWFEERTGGPPPASTSLLLRSLTRAQHDQVAAARLIVVQTRHPETLDGLLQHPATSPLLGERLGPTAVLLAEAHREGFRRALAGLGIDPEGLDPI